VEAPVERSERGQWSIRDIAPMVVGHFVGPGGERLP